MAKDPSEEEVAPKSDGRRSFLAGLIGAVVGLAPVVSGLVVFFHPLGRKSQGGRWVKVASLDQVPPDGKPVRFPVVADRRDAWSYYPPAPIGSVYLRRTGETVSPVAFTTVCPHLGCSVDFKPTEACFLCPCHNSRFTLEGKRDDPAKSPSPRDMDTLEVRVVDDAIEVNYQKFKGGVAEKTIEG